MTGLEVFDELDAATFRGHDVSPLGFGSASVNAWESWSVMHLNRLATLDRHTFEVGLLSGGVSGDRAVSPCLPMRQHPIRHASEQHISWHTLALNDHWDVATVCLTRTRSIVHLRLLPVRSLGLDKGIPGSYDGHSTKVSFTQ